MHWGVTERPTAPWVVQQLREAFPFDEAGRGARYLVFDRDTIFSAEVVDAVASMALEPTRTGYQSPWQNGVAERFVGTVRRELLDHVIVLDDRHLRRLLGEYLAYYHEDRTHLGIDKDAPLARPVEPRPAGAATVHAGPRVGGLHHRYSWGGLRRSRDQRPTTRSSESTRSPRPRRTRLASRSTNSTAPAKRASAPGAAVSWAPE